MVYCTLIEYSCNAPSGLKQTWFSIISGMSDLTELINSFLIKNEHFGLPSFFNKFLKFLKVCAAVSRVEHYPCFAKLASRAFRRFESEGVRVLMKT